MTTDVRTLLQESADVPDRGPDIDRAMRAARERHHRGRGLAALAAVVVLALVVGVIALRSGGGDDASVAVAPRQGSGSSVLDGRELRVEPGISITVPSGWDPYNFGYTDVAQVRVAIGTSQLPIGEVLTPCGDGGSPPARAGTWLVLWEYTTRTDPPIELPSGGTFGSPGGTVPERPPTFTTGQFASGSCPRPVGAPDGELAGSFEDIAFRDGGRLFVAHIAIAHLATSAADFSVAEQALDTLRVESAEPDVTVPTITTPPPFVATTDDERAIDSLIARWLYFQSDDEIRETIVGADTILDLIHEGMQQYRVNAPDGYSGDVHSLELTDATHATFEFTLLLHGSPLYTNQRGTAVKVDGRWMITRDSECSLLALGQLICTPE